MKCLGGCYIGTNLSGPRGNRTLDWSFPVNFCGGSTNLPCFSQHVNCILECTSWPHLFADTYSHNKAHTVGQFKVHHLLGWWSASWRLSQDSSTSATIHRSVYSVTQLLRLTRHSFSNHLGKCTIHKKVDDHPSPTTAILMAAYGESGIPSCRRDLTEGPSSCQSWCLFVNFSNKAFCQMTDCLLGKTCHRIYRVLSL